MNSTATSLAHHSAIRSVDLADIRPSPENDRLYRPIDPDDPEFIALARSIAQYGVKEPLVITLDGWILSGHRRYAAAQATGMDRVPCRIEPIWRTDDSDGFITLLREYNRQRDKSLDEQLREEVVSADPHEAYQALLAYRREKSDLSDFGDLSTIEPVGRKRRKAISAAKYQMCEAVLRVVEDRRDFWPLSDRSIHYALLNDPPLRHAGKPKSRYVNDRASYQDLTDLLTRARLQGLIPWDAIGDETRPVVLWRVEPDVRAFIRREMDGFLKGYWRDYQRSQPNHIELVIEKLTVRNIVQPVAQEYGLPLTIGRGYCSIMPRRQMAQRYHRSGKEKLIVLLLSDFDPDGESISESFARSMRDDFGIDSIVPIKVALTAAQVKNMRLPPQMKAKTGASTYRKFAQQHGDDVFELEAVPPVTLQNILRAAIEQVIDRVAINAELDAEREDAAFLETTRMRVHRALSKATGGA